MSSCYHRPARKNSTKLAIEDGLATQKALQPLYFWRRCGFTAAHADPPRLRIHAPFPLLPAEFTRDAEGGRDRLAPADAARRHDPPGGGRHLQLPAARLSRVAENL